MSHSLLFIVQYLQYVLFKSKNLQKFISMWKRRSSWRSKLQRRGNYQSKGRGCNSVCNWLQISAVYLHSSHGEKSKAWAACHQMKKIWNSDMKRILKIRLFQATVESILMYCSKIWTIPAALSKQNDGCYTRMFRMALNIRWYDKVSRKQWRTLRWHAKSHW